MEEPMAGSLRRFQTSRDNVEGNDTLNGGADSASCHQQPA
jgi:hypothetical protein